MSQTSPSPQAISSLQGRSSNKRSCIRCNQRKVGCDRNQPCGRCLESGVECKYPGNKRTPRRLKRPPISEIMAHLRKLEEEVGYLRSTSTANQMDISLQSSLNDASRRKEDNKQPQRSKGRLIVRGERSRYVDDEASVLIGNKVSLGFCYRDILLISGRSENYSKFVMNLWTKRALQAPSTSIPVLCPIRS